MHGRDSVSNHQPHDCLLNRLFRRRSKKTSKLRVTGLCAGNSPRTGEFPAQMASNAENVSIWWRHHDLLCFSDRYPCGAVTISTPFWQWSLSSWCDYHIHPVSVIYSHGAVTIFIRSCFSDRYPCGAVAIFTVFQWPLRLSSWCS